MRDRTGMMPLVVRDVVRETPSIVTIRLEHPDGRVLPSWEPGAHIDVQLVTRHERQYSLCGDPADVRAYRIAVLREELSRGSSAYVHRFLRVGSTVHVRPPRNLFPLGPADRYLLLAAGIGITPILAMARHLAVAAADWRMISLARRRDDVAFAAELAGFGERVSVHLSGEQGRLDLGAVLAGLPTGTDVYACGPGGFTDELTERSAALPPGVRLHLERFEPRRQAHGPDEAFTVACARSQLRVEVPADRPMLGTLQGAGLDLPGSCLRGVCGSCAVTVLDGVPDHRDSLTADPSSTTIYPCVSRSLTPEIVLDL
ncbi:PDR/VanB family oxidoreductase [Pseudolysinimonas sp.]|jgi:ferredoxin-NADP reductase|uniref:PDR/VanB family oxidoreductase n=1 Tax=Pseudolysinimonas sp. TaxID=2680009 RepID=UPI0037836876